MRWSKIVVPLVLIAAAGAAAWGIRGIAGQNGWRFPPAAGNAETESELYKTEPVRKGAIAVTISEDGSVAFGTQQQIFSLTGAESVSTADSSSSSAGQSGQGQSRGGEASMPGGMNGGGGGFSSSAGTESSAQSDSETLSLEVEEVYIRTGQGINEGDPVLKFTQESIDSCRTSLETALHSAELKVRQEEISVESARAEADYNYSLYLAEGKTAQATYDATIAKLDKAVADLEEDLEESQDLIDEYQEKVDDGEDYDDELEEEKEHYDDLQDELTIAKNNRVTQAIEAKKTYEEAMTNYRYADQLYEIDTDGLEDGLKEAQDALEEAQKALADFDEAVGDGTLTAEISGAVSAVSCQKGDELTDNSTVLEATDLSDASMTVLVAQEDIPNISIGDPVQISLDAFGKEVFSGEVSSIETSASMGSSTVNYSVKIAFTGDVSRIYAGMTGEAVFGIQSEEDVLYVSNAAVFQDGTRIFVKVQEKDGTIREQDVRTGFSNGRNVEILEGLTEGQTVVIGR